MPARIGEGVEPVPELGIQIVEVAERAAEEEVLPDVAEGALHLTLCLGPVGRTGLRQKPVMRRQLEQLAIIGDALIVHLAQHRRLHAVVEDLGRHPAERLESGDVAAQNGLQVLVRDEPAPHHAAVAEHHREQPDDPLGPGLVGEDGAEEGEIDLGLLTRRGLEAALKRLQRPWADGAQEVLRRGIAAGIAELPDLAQQPAPGQLGEGGDPLPQIRCERCHHTRPRLARAVGGRRKAALDVFADSLAIAVQLPGDRRDRQPLPMQIQNHYQLPQSDHRPAPPPIGRDHSGQRRSARRRASRGAPRKARRHTWGIFKRRFWGESLRRRHDRLRSAG